MPKTSPREDTASVGLRKANVHLEIRAHSCMNQTRTAKERDDLCHFLRQVHCRISEGDRKGRDDAVAEGTPQTGKSPSGKANKPPC